MIIIFNRRIIHREKYMIHLTDAIYRIHNKLHSKAVEMMNEHAKSNPQGLHSLFSNFMRG